MDSRVYSVAAPHSAQDSKKTSPGVGKPSNSKTVPRYSIRVSGFKGVNDVFAPEAGYRPQWVNQSIILVSSIILDPHSIIKEADVMEHATSNVARLRRNTKLCECMYRGVNDVFPPEGTGHNGWSRA